MGIVGHFLHADVKQLQMLRQQPALFWNIGDDPRFASARRIDVDKDWEIVSWLVSGKKQKEQEEWAAMMNVLSRSDSGKFMFMNDEEAFDKIMNGDEAFDTALEEERKKLGISNEDTTAMPTDRLLEAIEGRGGTNKQSDEAFDFGLGAARVFSPPEVQAIARAFAESTEAHIRTVFDRKRMAKYHVGDMKWLEEQDSVLDDFLLPAFRKIKSFYEGAAKTNHSVIVSLSSSKGRF